MIVTIAIDSWKGCLDSLDAARSIETGLRRVCPDLEARLSPLADGGEGTTCALCTPEERIPCTVTGPLGEPVRAEYGIRRATGTAVLEMASAAGLPLVPPDRRNPLYTTTRGVGELLCDALDRGCRNFLIGIGGSATNDGGAGMLAALGFRLLDAAGSPIPDGAAGLEQLCSIDASAAFLGAQLRPGAAIVLEETGLTGLLSGSDLCFTGEGRFDFQTSMGKAPAAVARFAREQGIPVIALAGSVQPDAPLGEIDAVFPVLRAPMSLADAMDPETARQNIAAAAEQILRLWLRARQ